MLPRSARGAVTLRASREGFESATIVTVWEEDAHPISLYLKSLEPALPITPGSYTLTVTSHPSGHRRRGCLARASRPISSAENTRP